MAVKVQRPGIRTQVERDLALVATLARRLERRAGFRAAFADTVDDWLGGRAEDLSVPRLLLSGLALGARHRVTFPRELMLVARALVTLEATAVTIDQQLNFVELVRPMLPALRHMLMPSPRALDEHLHRHRFEYLNLAIELPSLLQEGIARRHRATAAVTAPSRPPAGRRWLPLGAAFAAGAALAAFARRPACDRAGPGSAG